MDPNDTGRGRLVLVRHGETRWSASGRHTGRTDVPLDARGRRQARGLEKRLRNHRFVEVWASPLSRAQETARHAGFGDRAVACEDLLEWDYGEDEGRTTPEIREERPGWSIWGDGPLGGEGLDQVAERAGRVVSRARATPGDVLVFAHAHLLRVLTTRWLDLPPIAAGALVLGPAAVSVLGWERETPALWRWNDTGLRPLEDL